MLIALNMTGALPAAVGDDELQDVQLSFFPGGGVWRTGARTENYSQGGAKKAEAETVRALFDLYLKHGVARSVAGAANTQGLLTQAAGRPGWDRAGRPADEPGPDSLRSGQPRPSRPHPAWGEDL